MLSHGCSLILILLLAGCSLDPIYISRPPDDGTFIWTAPGSVSDGYQPVPVGPPAAHEPAFVCRAQIRNLGFHGFHTGELRDGRCKIPEYGKVWVFSAPHYEQLLSRTDTPYRWARLAEFTARPLMIGPLYTNNKVHTDPLLTETDGLQTTWFPCAVMFEGHWRAGKIDIGTSQSACYIANDLGIVVPFYEGVVVLYAPILSR